MRHLLLIDGNYLFFSQKRLDYLKFKKHLEKALQKRIIETHYVENSLNIDTNKQQGFYTWLRSAEPHGPHFQVHLLPMREVTLDCPHCGKWTRKQVVDGVETKVVQLMMKLAYQDKFDRLILVTGDSVYADTVRYLKDDMKRKVTVCGFESALAVDLQNAADFVIWIDKFYDDVKRESRPDRAVTC